MSQYSQQARARILKRLGLPEDLGGKSDHDILWNTDNWTPEIIAAHARHIADHRQNNPYFEKTYTGAANNPLYKGYYPEDLAQPQPTSSKTEVGTPAPASKPTVIPTGIPEGADPKKYGYFKDDGSLETDPVKIAAAMRVVYKGVKSYYNDNGTEKSKMVDTDLPSLVYSHPTSKASVDIAAQRLWRDRENPGYFLSKDRAEGGTLYDDADYGNRISSNASVDNVRTAYPEKKYNFAPLGQPTSTVPMKDGTPIDHLHASEWTEDLLRTHFAPRAAAVIAARHEILNSKAKGDTKNTEEENTRIYNAGLGAYQAQPQTSEPTPSVAAPASESTEESASSERFVTTKDQYGLPNIRYTAPSGATMEQRAVAGPNGEHVGHVTLWKTDAGRLVGLLGPYDIDDWNDDSPEEQQRGMAELQAEKLDKNIAKNPNIFINDTGLQPDGSPIKPLKMPTNEELYNKIVNPKYVDDDEDEDSEPEEPILDANKTHAEPTITPPASVAPSVANNVSTQMASVTPSTNGVPFWAQGNPNWTAPKSGPIGKVSKSRATEKDWSDLQAKADAEATRPASTYTQPISYPKNTLNIYKPKAVSMTPTFDTGNGSYTMIIPTGSSVPSGLEKGWSAAKKNGRAFFVDDNDTLSDPDTGEVKGHRAYKSTYGARYGLGTKYYSVHLGHTSENCPDNQQS